MDNNFIAVSLKKLFAVTGSAVFLINRAGLGIVDDMRFQNFILCHFCFHILDDFHQFMISGSTSIYQGIQSFLIVNIMLL